MQTFQKENLPTLSLLTLTHPKNNKNQSLRSKMLTN